MAKGELDDAQLEAAKRLYKLAACIGKESRLFDATDPKSKLAEAAFQSCKRCQVRKECLLVIEPERNYFDGIAGGLMFSEGKQIKQTGEK